MLRIFFSLLVLSMAGGMMGCCHTDNDHHILYHMAGVCDCDQDEAPCTHRAPWATPVRPASATSTTDSQMSTTPPPRPLPVAP